VFPSHLELANWEAFRSASGGSLRQRAWTAGRRKCWRAGAHSGALRRVVGTGTPMGKGGEGDLPTPIRLSIS